MIYVEGGGAGKSLRGQLRQGFSQFFERAGLKDMMPRLVACGGRDGAYKRFGHAQADLNTHAILLVDSEGPVTKTSSWEHLKDRDGWDRPASVADDQCHLMVQVMESWFLADKEALSDFYGHSFRRKALPQRHDIENVSKQDVFTGLKKATKGTGKRRYNKGSHSFAILAKIDPEKVMDVSPHAKRLVTTLKKLSSS